MSSLNPEKIAVDLIGWLFVAVIGVLVPVAAVRSARRDSRTASHQTITQRLRNVVFLIVLACIALFVAWRENIALFPAVRWTPALAGLSVAILVGVLALAEALLRTRSVEERKKLWVRQIIPRNSAERALWVVSSITAGATEEIIFRGVFFVLVAAITGSIMAAVISATVFALAHYRQGWKSMAFIAPTALLFQWLVIFAGSLIPAMIVHAACNIVRGLRASAAMNDAESQ
jgi:membrane protease YdiL (CAAX protease family)